MLKVRFTTQMKRDYKLQKKRGKNPALLETVLEKLANRIPLESKYQDHALSGDWASYRECHIENDWLLIYTIDEGELIFFVRIPHQRPRRFRLIRRGGPNHRSKRRAPQRSEKKMSH